MSYVEWCCSELSKFLGVPSGDEVIQYVANIHNEDDLKEYLSDILNVSSNPEYASFIEQVITMRRQRVQTAEPSSRPSSNSNRNSTSQGTEMPTANRTDMLTVYKKPENAENYVVAASASKEQGGKKNKRSQKTKNGKTNSEQNSSESSTDKKGGKKTKYVSLYTDEGKAKDVINLPGRHPCSCQASKHQLIANCLKCGRIVCTQEGSGPCLTCGNLVCTRKEREYLATGSKKSKQLYEKLMAGADENKTNNFTCTELQKAIEHKNKLLEYDRTSAKRTQVIDDDSDYFVADKWLPHDQREKLRAKAEELHNKRHASRLDRKVTLDFAGRTVIEEEDTVDYAAEIEDYIKDEEDKSMPEFELDQASEYFPNIDPTIDVQFPEYSDDHMAITRQNKISTTKNKEMNWSKALRIQDRGLLEMSDMGMCLSMHQPWASLLVSGIKKHEGRTWYTAHRGRLWIQAGSRVPTRQEIKEIERSYEALSRDVDLHFPDHYPTGCLLGCVNVVDCLPQEEYRQQYPDGESESPYVFICEDPQELIVKFPIKGKHKIFKLDPKIHQAALKTLRKV